MVRIMAQTISEKKYLGLLLALYAGVRLFSYVFSPETPLIKPHLFNSAVSLIALLAIGYLLMTKNIWGWYGIALEFILGGSGGYLGFHGITLRTWLLGAAIVAWGFSAIGLKRSSTTLPVIRPATSGIIKNIPYVIFLLWAVALFGVLYGFWRGHSPRLIIADLIPYAFFFYYFPLRKLTASKGFHRLCRSAVSAAVIGNLLLIAFTLAGFSTGIFVLQDSYYHWYRDVALGKITELPFHFYRLVLDEHLLLIPLMLYFLYQIIYKKFAFSYGLLTAGLLAILSANLTRIYLVALVTGMLLLFSPARWKRWLVVSASAIFFFIAFFSLLHWGTSRGHSFGWELFGLRLGSIAAPAIEDSSLSRLWLLPKILEKIRHYPLLGTGLGDTVTVYSPIFKAEVATPHFDWGYLELWAEVGTVGLLVWFMLLGWLIKKNWQASLPRWLPASLGALAITNLTAPALFHTLGVSWLVMLLAL